MVEDLGDDDNDDEFFGGPRKEEEEEFQIDDPEVEREVIEDDKEEEEEDEDDEVQVVTRSGPRTNKSTPEGMIAFDPEIHDVTGYEKVDIIKLRNKAFKGNGKYAKRVKGSLIGIPFGQVPTIQQINSTELFALCAPLTGKSENNDEDEEGPPKEANIHRLWLPFLQGNGALGNCPPTQFKPPRDWRKVYTAQGLQVHFSMEVTAWKSCEPLASLIIVVPPDSPELEKEHFLDHLHSDTALKRYSLGIGKQRKQFAFCPSCGIQSENQVSAYSHARRQLNIEFLCEACAKYHT